MTPGRCPFSVASPIVLASGPAGFGTELAERTDLSAIGALTTKTVTPQPREGNPQPRLVDCPCGMINSIGLENPGFDVFVERCLQDVLSLPTRHIISVAAERPEELARMVGALSAIEGIDAIEINLSCPNVDAVVIGSDRALVGRFTEAARGATERPLLIKLPGDAGYVVASAEAALDAGADGLTLINSIRGLRIDHRVGRPMLHRETGGLSGPAILPIALARVFEARKAFPDALIVGTGGVTDLESAIEMMAAGADLVGVGYGMMANPQLPTQLARRLEAWLAERRLDSVKEVIGVAHRGGFDVP